MKSDEALNQLMELMKEHPGVPVLPMVDGEITRGDEYSWWCGSWGRAAYDEFIIDNWYGDGCVRFKSEGISTVDTLIEGYAELVLGDCTIEENWSKAEDYIASAWKPAIVVYIGLPEEKE